MRYQFLAVLGVALMGAVGMSKLGELLSLESPSDAERGEIRKLVNELELMAQDASAIIQQNRVVFSEHALFKNGISMNTTGSNTANPATGIQMYNRAATPDRGMLLFRYINSEPVMTVGLRDPADNDSVAQMYISDDSMLLQIRGKTSLSITDDGTDFLYEFIAPAGSTDSRVKFQPWVNFVSSGELTIAAGVVTAIGTIHTIDTQNNDATDDLDTINGGSIGDLLIVSAIDSTHTVVVKDGAGNIDCAGDFSMDHVDDRMMLIYDGTNWVEISRSDNNT